MQRFYGRACMFQSAFTGSQFRETPSIGGVYAVTANEVLSGKELSFLMKSAGRFHDG